MVFRRKPPLFFLLPIIFAVVVSGCSTDANDKVFSVQVDMLGQVDTSLRAKLNPTKTHQQDIALADGLMAKVDFASARGVDGALYLFSISITVDDTDGWTLSVGPASPPLNVGAGRGKEAVMQPSILLTQTQNTGVTSRSRTTMVNVRADGKIAISN